MKITNRSNRKFPNDPTPIQDERGASTGVAQLGIAAAFLATLCCLGPLIPILLGLGFGTALFGLEQFKPWFLGVGISVLALGAWWAIRRQNRCFATRSTARDARIASTIFGVGIGAYLTLQYALVPALAGLASDRLAADRGSASPHEAPATGGTLSARIEVAGMTCAGCAVGVEEALRSVDGVERAEVNWRTGDAEVTFDPERVTVEEILKATVEPQYALRARAASDQKLQEDNSR